MSRESEIHTSIKNKLKDYDALFKLFYNLSLDAEIDPYFTEFISLASDPLNAGLLSADELENLLLILVTKYVVILKSENVKQKQIESHYDILVYAIAANKLPFDPIFKSRIFAIVDSGVYFTGTRSSAKYVKASSKAYLEKEIIILRKTTIVQKDFDVSLSDADYVEQVLIKKIRRLLSAYASNENKKKIILEILDKIPENYKRHEIYGRLFLSFQYIAFDDPDTKSLLTEAEEKDIITEIVFRHLVLLEIYDRQAYHEQIKKYNGGSYRAINLVSMGVIESKVSRFISTKQKLGFLPDEVAKHKTSLSKVVLLSKGLNRIDTYSSLITKLELSMVSGGERYEKFLSHLYSVVAASKINPAKIIVTPVSGTSWQSIKRDTSLLFTNVNIYDENAIKLREEQETKLALNELDVDISTDRILKLQKIEIEKTAKEIVEKFKSYEKASVLCKYAANKFELKYYYTEKATESIDLNPQIENIKEILSKAIRYQLSLSIYLYDNFIDDEAPPVSDEDEKEIELPDFDVNTSCLDFIDSDPLKFYECFKYQRQAYADGLLKIAKGAGQVLTAIAEILNPADPTNLTFLAFVKGFSVLMKSAKFVATGVKAVKIKQLKTVLLVARWGAKKAKVILEAAYKRFKLRGNIKAAGRTIVRGRQHAHHIVTIESLGTRTVQAAVTKGFDINSAKNGAVVWAKAHRNIHKATYGDYNKFILNEIMEWEAKNGSRADFDDAAKVFVETELIGIGESMIYSNFEKVH